MPTLRFLNLEEEKRRRILEAAIKEFSSYDYDKVSINRIIQESDISRGAFYTYFLDKDDLLVHLFEAEEDKAVRYFMEIMQRNQGDFFQSIQEWVIEIVKVRKKQIVQDSFAMFYRSGFLYYFCVKTIYIKMYRIVKMNKKEDSNEYIRSNKK